MRSPLTRRRLLGTVAGLTAAAGCVSSGNAPSFRADGNETATTSTPASTTTTREVADDDLDEWLADANGYDGSIPRVGHESASIWVGDTVEHSDEYLAFDPPAIEISPGTPVHWEWSGHGGEHNIVSVDGAFESGDPVEANTGTIFTHTFDETGTYPYVCESHEEDGMKGAIVVAVPPKSDYPAVNEWLAPASNWEGNIADETDTDVATVTVGAENHQGAFAFDPPAIKISSGTTVAWDWRGQGGGHDVVFEEADVRSSDMHSESGVNFEHAFVESGVYRYLCRPHEGIGMKGAIIVE